MLNDKRLQNYPHCDTYTHRHVFFFSKDLEYSFSYQIATQINGFID